MASSVFNQDSTLQDPDLDPSLLEDPSLIEDTGQVSDPTVESEMSEPTDNPEEESVELEQDIVDALKSIIDRCKEIEQPYRESQLQIAKKFQLFYHGHQFVYWSDVARDWQGPNLYSSDLNLDPSLLQDISNYTKVINIFKAHTDSIIGALSTGTPSVRSFPEDPDSPEDIIAARARTNIAELVQDQNNAPMLFVRALYLLSLYGYCGAYNRSHEDKKYGTVQKPNIKMGMQEIANNSCPVCAMPMSVEPEAEENYSGNMIPDGENTVEISIDQEIENELGAHAQQKQQEQQQLQMQQMQMQQLQAQQQGQQLPPQQQGQQLPPQPQQPQEPQPQICQNCGTAVPPDQQSVMEEAPVTEGFTEVPKSREIIELYGPLNLTIPASAKRQEDVGYLFLEDEFHYAQMRSIYPEYAEKIAPAGHWNEYERWARHLTGLESLQDQVTSRRVWLRPFMFWTHDDEIVRNKLFEKFPTGVYCSLVNDELLEALEENLDDHWTLTMSPTEESIATSDPLMKSLMPIQETTNDAYNIVLQQMQYGIADTFVDQGVVNLTEYAKTANVPGMMYEVKNQNPGRPISDYFYQLKTATMSKELDAFMDKLETAGQFVTGAFPSVFGGPQANSGGTLGEYEQSRNQSLQRLSLPWKMLSEWWSLVITKCTASFIENMLEDEKYTKPQGSSFVNVWIRRTDLVGKVGKTSSQSSEQFPLSWAQKGAIIFKLLGLSNEGITQTILSPDNIDAVSRTFGLTDLKMPGENDRLKQLAEISQMLRGEAIMPDQMLDNHELEAGVCRNWLVSLEGQDSKLSNPQGYQLVYQHFIAHNQIVQQKMMEQQQQQAAMAAAAGGGKGQPPAPGEKGVPQQ